MYYRVTLLNNSLDKSYADVVPYQHNDTVVFHVYSENNKLKNHLESVLQREAYIMAPGVNNKTYASDGVFHLYPNTVYYLQALPEILAWRGYNAKYVNETHKSMTFVDEDLMVMKSADDNIYYNNQGERIVKIVPQGYVAVSNDGRVVAGGRYLNANIDKEGADWTLMPNPYENMSEKERQQQEMYMNMQLQDYHPGAHEELYHSRETDTGDYFQAKQEFEPKGKKLHEVYPAEEPEEEEVPEAPSEVQPDLPESIPAGKVLYSPELGIAMNSEFWPPDVADYGKYSWYVFNDTGLSDDEKSLYESMMGPSPALVQGIDKGPVETDKNMDISEGFKLSLPRGTQNQILSMNSGIVINEQPEVKYPLTEMTSTAYREKVKVAGEALSKIKALTSERDPDTGETRVSDKLKKLYIPDLRGLAANWLANFDGREYQKAGVLALVEESQYEKFGGPRGWHGHFLNWKYGLGKTAVVTAANAILRNRGRIASGTQTTIVTAPNKNVYVWQNEVGKFLGEYAEVIDGSREERIRQWETLIDKARDGNMPSFVILGSSKFRFTRADAQAEEDADDAWELDIDAQYMKLLALGGRSGSKEVKGKHVGAFVTDESGQYVNPDAGRHHALQEIIDSVYNGGGLTWSLNGDISGNSATDTISEMSFINKYVRENYIDLAQEYTKTNRNTNRESKQMNRRIWKDVNRLRDFMATFGNQIYPLDGRTVAGEDFGFQRTDDTGSPLGATWGKVYEDAQSKLRRGAEVGKMNRALGLMSILIGCGYGAVSPARLLEYDLGNDELMQGVARYLPPDDMVKFRQEMQEFLNRATETKNRMALGRLPRGEYEVPDRDRIYNDVFSESSRMALEQAVSSWDAPILDEIVNQVDVEMKNNQPAGSNLKMGIAGFSKRAIRNLYNRLKDRYSDDKVLINIVDGDTSPMEVQEAQTRHQKEKDRTVISLVTGAGLYGLSLPAERSWRFPTWNSAKAGQYEGRFHRKAEQHNVTTVMVPDGVSQYMRELELMKGEMARQATNALLEANDDSDELNVRGVGSLVSFLDRLNQYKPRILERESGE